MRLLELVLRGYKRLMTNNINEIIYTPNSVYQILLGTNGSGKSSVLREANPLPPAPSDFVKNGEKISVWEQDGVIFKLTSSFKGGGKHSFIRQVGDEEEELNPGGTATVQKELIYQIFRFTTDLKELLTGEVLFTQMSTSKRREWLTSLCDTDFTYAIGLYNKLRSAGRDTQGAYKHVGNRLTNEIANLERLGDMSEIEQTADLIREELDILLPHRKAERPNMNWIDSELNREMENAENLSKWILEAVRALPNHNFSSVTEIEDTLNSLRNNIESKKSLLVHYSEDCHELEELELTLRKTGTDGIESLKARYTEVTAKIAALRSIPSVFTEQSEARLLYTVSEEAIPLTVNLFNEIPDNSDRRFSRTVITEKRELQSTLKTELDKAHNRRNGAEFKIETVRKQEKTNCPQCDYSWVPGFSPDVLTKLHSRVAVEDKLIEEKTAELKVVEAYLRDAEEYSGFLSQFKGLLSNYPRLKGLWDYLIENEALYNNPKSWIPKLYEWVSSVERWIEIQSLTTELDDLQHALEASSKIEGSKHVTERLGRLKKLVEDTTAEIEYLKGQDREVSALLNSVNLINERYSKLSSTIARLLEMREAYLNGVRDILVKDLTTVHQNRLAEIQRQLTERDTLKEIIKDLNSQHEELKRDQEVYKLLVETLSPTEGLIAEQLTGFIRTFTEHLNSIIDRIWTYDLKVLPCGLDSGELDYRFPLFVKTNDNNTPDIGKASTGQMEIVDFAFKLIVMSYLKLVDYPLYLDELGASFDDQHRINTMNFIKELMETGQFSQVFLISHYASSHGTFTQAETLVMDPANIVVPDKYNTHVVLA